MTPLFLLLLLAIDGTVVNKSTGKPGADVTVTLNRLSEAGPSPVATVKSGADGTYKIDQAIDGPYLLQATFDGVNYNKLLRPGMPVTNLEIEIFNVTHKAGDARIVQHMMLVEPGEGKISINESVIYRNDTKNTYNDASAGTFRFYLPPEAKDLVQVRVTGPGNMPRKEEYFPAGPAHTYKVNFALKPGESRFDLQYEVPSGKLKGRILHAVNEKEGPTRLVTPSGVKLTGAGIEDLGAEPQTQAEVYSLTKADYEIEVTGTGSLRALDPDENSMPEPQAIPPKINDRMYWIVGLSLFALSLGFITLLKKA